MATERKYIGKYLRRFREAFKLKQNKVAAAVGLAPQMYIKYEKDQMSPSVTLVINLANEFNVSADYLLGLSDEPRPRTTDPSWTGEMIDCRDALWQVLGKVDRILGGSTYGHLQNHESAQRQAVHRADTATA